MISALLLILKNFFFNIDFGKIFSSILSFIKDNFIPIVAVVLVTLLILQVKSNTELKAQIVLKDSTIKELTEKANKQKEDFEKLIQINSNICKKEQKIKSKVDVLFNSEKNTSIPNDSLNIFMSERKRCYELASGAKPNKGEKNSLCSDYLH